MNRAISSRGGSNFRIFVAGSLVSIFIGILSGGSAGASVGKVGASPPGLGGKPTGKVVYWDPIINPINPALQSSMDTLDKVFAGHYPGASISRETPTTNPTAYNTDFQATIVSGNGPDAMVSFMPIQPFVAALTPLNSVVTPEMRKDIPGLSTTTFNGKIYGIPRSVGVLPLYFNKAMFRKAKLNPNRPPTTFTQLKSTCRALLKAGVTPIAGGISDGFLFQWMLGYFAQGTLTAAQMQAISADPHKLMNPQLYQAAQDVADLFKMGCFQKGYQSTGLFQGIANWEAGQAAMVWGSANGTPDYVTKLGASNVGVIPAMGVKSAKPYHYLETVSSAWIIPSYAKNKAGAWAYIKFLTSRAAQKYLEGRGNYLSPNTSITAEPPLPGAAVITSILKYNPTLPRMGVSIYPSAWGPTFYREMQAVVNGSTTVQAAFAAADKALNP